MSQIYPSQSFTSIVPSLSHNIFNLQIRRIRTTIIDLTCPNYDPARDPSKVAVVGRFIQYHLRHVRFSVLKDTVSGRQVSVITYCKVVSTLST